MPFHLKDFEALARAAFDITNDAVYVFDQDGIIIESNAQATILSSSSNRELLGQDIRDFFYLFNMEKAPKDELPFPTDGSGVTIFSKLADGSFIPVEVHSKSFIDRGRKFYIASARNTDLTRQIMHEREHLIRQLRLANKRLEGLLSIVTSTLGNDSFDVLSTKVLDELAAVIEGNDALFYRVEDEGYRLMGTSSSSIPLRVGSFFVQKNHGVPGLIDKERKPLHLRFVEPKKYETSNPLPIALDVVSGERYRIMSVLPELAQSVLAFPIFAAGKFFGVIIILWEDFRFVTNSDFSLVQSVAEILGIEFKSALSFEEQQRKEKLELVLARIRDLFYRSNEFNRELVNQAIELVKEQIYFEYVIIQSDKEHNRRVADFSSLPDQEGLHKLSYSSYREEIAEGDVVPISYFSPLGGWIRERSSYNHGLLISLGKIQRIHVDIMALRQESDVPFDKVELEFWKVFALTMHEATVGKLARAQDTHISLALQRAMQNELPQVEGLKTASLYQSATDRAVIGGDYFDLIKLDDKQVIVLMGDISGKGIEAASMASLVKTATAAYAFNKMHPSEIVSALNTLYYHSSRTESFTTLFIALINLKTHQASYCCAGHPSPFLYHENELSQELKLLTVQSPIVGAFNNMSYVDGFFDFEPGDILYLYTDGTTEARSARGDFFGDARLREVFLEAAEKGLETIPHSILEELESFSGHALKDDVAMVAIEFE
ncbi:MAG: SpoIIE family protein phosphatase [Coriobacteriia bacterium]|nr:SpoIIE family protein phosphatase [Coriobacteriia bacterium]